LCQVISHSHTRAVMSASPELTHYLSEPTKDAPPGGAGIKQVEVRGRGEWGCSAKRGGEKQCRAQTETVHPSPGGLLGVSRSTMTDLSIVTWRLTHTGSWTHLVATTAEQQTRAGWKGVEVHLLQAEGQKRGPEPRQLPLSLCPHPTSSDTTGTPTTSPPRGSCHRGEGGPDLPGCIWLTGDWEGALRAHVTIDNSC
ncbi:hypothetical protein GOODEAATRI_031910, partial [Goodea atripinnis]